jgi:hypothetical protein
LPGQGDRHGPPAWSHGRHLNEEKHARSFASKKLIPAQRSAMMTRLARAHAVGMKRWRACLAAHRDPCARPLPPGLAKRR